MALVTVFLLVAVEPIFAPFAKRVSSHFNILLNSFPPLVWGGAGVGKGASQSFWW